MNNEQDVILQLAQDVSYIKGTLMGDMSAMKENIKNIEKKIERESERNSEKVSKIFEVETRLNNIEKELEQQKDTNKWLVRLVGGTIITIAISAFVWLLTGKNFLA